MSDEQIPPGYVLMEWRNKTLEQGEDFDHRWHRYLVMKKEEAKDFMENKAHRSGFFQFRIQPKKKVIVSPEPPAPVPDPSVPPSSDSSQPG